MMKVDIVQPKETKDQSTITVKPEHDGDRNDHGACLAIKIEDNIFKSNFIPGGSGGDYSISSIQNGEVQTVGDDSFNN